MTKLPWYLRLGTTTHVLGRWRAADALACIAEQRIPSVGGRRPADRAAAARGPRGLRPRLRADARRRRGRVATRARPRGEVPLRRGVLHPLLVHRERRLRHGHRVRRRRRRGPLHRRPPARRHRGGHLRRRGRARPRRRGGRGLAALAHVDGGVLARPRGHRPRRSCATGCAPATSASSTTRGLLRLAGRLKEMFIRGGYNVYPAEVEAVLADHPSVAEVVVVPRPDDVMGEIGVAVVVPADPSRPPTWRTCGRSSSRRLARYKLPEAHPDRRRAPAHPDAEGRPPRPGGPRRLRDPLTPRCHPRGG